MLFLSLSSVYACVLFNFQDCHFSYLYEFHCLFLLSESQLAGLLSDDMNAVNNMRLLEGSSDAKKSTIGAFSLKFEVPKVNICIVLKR